MPTDRSHIQENDSQRQRLRDFVAKVTDTELKRPLEAGWTVAAVLGHVAFWDQRTLLLLERWSRDGTPSIPGAGWADRGLDQRRRQAHAARRSAPRDGKPRAEHRRRSGSQGREPAGRFHNSQPRGG